MYNKKWILYNQWWSTQWLNWEDTPKPFPKLNSHQNKVTVTTGGLLPIWSTTAFWIPVKPLHLRSMLSKSIRCTENYNACSPHWLTEWAHFFSTATPNYTLHNQCFKNWMNWATEVLPHVPYSWPLANLTFSSISAAFCRENTSTTSRRQKMLSKEFVESWSMDFYATGINKCISLRQKCIDGNGFYFD